MKNIAEITIVLILVVELLLLQIIRLRDIIINVVFFITIQSRLQYALYVISKSFIIVTKEKQLDTRNTLGASILTHALNLLLLGTNFPE